MRGKTPSKRKLDDHLDGAGTDTDNDTDGELVSTYKGEVALMPLAQADRVECSMVEDGRHDTLRSALPAQHTGKDGDDEYDGEGCERQPLDQPVQMAEASVYKRIRTMTESAAAGPLPISVASSTGADTGAKRPPAASSTAAGTGSKEGQIVPAHPEQQAIASVPASGSGSASNWKPAKPSKVGKNNGGASGNGGGRLDNSLGHLTEKFLNLVEGSQYRELDLNETADRLQVQKRRIYDIVNVLEGIGVVSKHSKNKIVWNEQFEMTGSNAGTSAVADGAGAEVDPKEEEARAAARARDAEIEKLNKEVADLGAEERAIQESIAQLQNELNAMSNGNIPDKSNHENNSSASARLAYVTHEDIYSIPEFQGRTVWAIKAPMGSELMIPDPANQLQRRRDDSAPKQPYQIFLRSSGGAIEWFRIRDPSGSHGHTHKATGSAASPAQHQQHMMSMLMGSGVSGGERHLHAPSPDHNPASVMLPCDGTEEEAILQQELPYDYLNLGMGAEMYGDDYAMGQDERTLADLFC